MSLLDIHFWVNLDLWLNLDLWVDEGIGVPSYKGPVGRYDCHLGLGAGAGGAGA